MLLTLQVSIVVVALVVWQRGADSGALRPVVFSSPEKVFDRLATWWEDGTLVERTLSTLRVMLIGWILAITVGSTLGAVMGLSRYGRQFLEPFVIFFLALPNLILLPFFVIWLGFGATPRILLVMLAVTFIVAMTVADGISEVSDDYVAHAKVVGADGWDLVRHVYVPSAVLHILASSRVTVGYAYTAAVVAELFGSTDGLGYLIVRGQALLQVADVYAALCVVFLLGLVSDMILARVQTRATRWIPK